MKNLKKKTVKISKNNYSKNKIWHKKKHFTIASANSK